MVERLVLGTVQFGVPYGVTNFGGQTSAAAAHAILDFCWEAGIRTLDTSRLYGSSEAVLGASQAGDGFEVITKARSESAAGILAQIETSLSVLRRKTVRAVLIHNFEAYRKSPEIYAGLQEAKRRGYCSQIGFSLYEAAELNAVLGEVPVDLIQVPVNALDTRILPSLVAAKSKGVIVHARSPFLQGLLANASFATPAHLSALDPARQRFLQWAQNFGMSPLVAALALPLAHPNIDRVVLGVNDLVQAQQIVDATRSVPESLAWPNFRAPSYYLNPANWQA